MEPSDPWGGSTRAAQMWNPSMGDKLSGARRPFRGPQGQLRAGILTWGELIGAE